MDIEQTIRSALMRRWVKPENIANEKKRFQKKRARAGLPHKVKYFHQVDDPYSHLAAQTLAKLSELYDIELQTYVVCQPDDVDVPERAMLAAHARNDCVHIAPHYGLSFAQVDSDPLPELILLAQRILSEIEGTQAFIDWVQKVSEALWKNDASSLESFADQLGVVSSAEGDKKLQNKLQENHKKRLRLGHYLGATFFYGSQWYWGVDRLCYLEEYLGEQGLRKIESLAGDPPTVISRPVFKHIKNQQENEITLEYFHSLRSPYTYISMARVYELAANLNINLVMRPVLPMMMRGVPARHDKGRYIFSDAKREADTVFKVPFGKICDPFGEPVKRAYSLFTWAHEQDKSKALFLNFYRAAFSKGLDLSQDAGMKEVVEESGLDWQAAKDIIDNKDWEGLLEDNRKIMYEEMGVWGVPSFRLSRQNEAPLSVWGADRLWLLEAEIEKQLMNS